MIPTTGHSGKGKIMKMIKISGCQGRKMREMNRQSQEDLQGSENALYGTIPKNTRHYVFCQTH